MIYLPYAEFEKYLLVELMAQCQSLCEWVGLHTSEAVTFEWAAARNYVHLCPDMPDGVSKIYCLTSLTADCLTN